MFQIGTLTGVSDAYVWGLRNPATGSKTFAGSWTGSASAFTLEAISFVNVSQTADNTTWLNFDNTGSGTSTLASKAITNASNNAAVGFYMTGSSFSSTGTGTDIFNFSSHSVAADAANWSLSVNPTLTYNSGGGAWTSAGFSIAAG
jgi:hypothetical protein